MSSVFSQIFSGLGCSPVGGKFFSGSAGALLFTAQSGIIRVAADRGGYPFRGDRLGGFGRCRAPGKMWELGGELVKHPGEKASGWALGGGPALYLFSRSLSRCRNSSMSLHSLASSKSRSRSASRACCTSNSLAVGVVMFTSPFWSPWSAVRWAVAVWLPLAPDDSGDFLRRQ